MGGVYGDQLSAFYELFEDRDILRFDTAIGAGLTNEQVVYKNVFCYLSRKDGGEMGVVADLRTGFQKATLFVEHDDVPSGGIQQGMYVRDDGELYIVSKDQGFSKEGGFHIYGLKLVTGNTDVQKAHRHVNLGPSEYE